MSIQIAAGQYTSKLRAEAPVFVADWDQQALAAGVTLADAGVFVVQPADGTLAIDAVALQAGSRTVQFRVSGGRVGRRYKIAHRVTTADDPAQTLQQSFFLLVNR